MQTYKIVIGFYFLNFLGFNPAQGQTEDDEFFWHINYLHTSFECAKKYFIERLYFSDPSVFNISETIHNFSLSGDEGGKENIFAHSRIDFYLCKKKERISLEFEEDLEVLAQLDKLKYIILNLGRGYNKYNDGLPYSFKSNKSIEALNFMSDYRYLVNSYYPPKLKYLFIRTWHRNNKKYRNNLFKKLGKLDSLKSLVFLEYPNYNTCVYERLGVCPCVKAKNRDRSHYKGLIKLPSEIQNFHNLEELDINVNLLNKENIEILAKLSKLKRLAVYVCPEEKEFDYELLTKLNFLEGLYIKTGFEMDCPNYSRFKAKLQKYLPQTYIDYFEAEDKD